MHPIQAVYYLVLPGVVVHELSHLIVVLLTPGVKVDEVDLTSHVKHSGSYTFFSTFLISYSPFIFHTILSGILVFLLRETFSWKISVINIGLSVFLFYGITVLCITAFPSYDDAISPWMWLKWTLFSWKFPIAILYLPFLFLFGLPGLVFSIILEKLPISQYTIGIAYSISLIWLGFNWESAIHL